MPPQKLDQFGAFFRCDKCLNTKETEEIVLCQPRARSHSWYQWHSQTSVSGGARFPSLSPFISPSFPTFQLSC